MPLSAITAAEALAQLDAFDTVIDARSPAEYAEDRLPGAVNWPSLDDDQRAEVGTRHQQQSAFEARKRGAALVARNIADHLDREMAGKSKDWSPLVYCWRGGKRSGSLALVLEQIGFRVRVLEGGYREYRRAVVGALETLPATLAFRVVCGTTGSGKSRLLKALAARGAQVLDLEALANHRGSVLGLVPGQPQPTQKAFDSRVWDALRRFDPARPGLRGERKQEDRRPARARALIRRMRASPCIALALGLEQRVALLMDEYDFFVREPASFCARLDALRALCGNDTVNGWQAAVQSGGTAEVVRELLVRHYDPIYRQSMQRNFAAVSEPTLSLAWDGSAAGLEDAAARLLSAPVSRMDDERLTEVAASR